MGFFIPAPSTPNVLVSGHRLQVGRVAARWVSAEVINLKASGNGANKVLVKKSMSQVILSLKPNNAVRLSFNSAHKKPASCVGFLVDLLVDAVDRMVEVGNFDGVSRWHLFLCMGSGQRSAGR